jgi:hypothetical protein
LEAAVTARYQGTSITAPPTWSGTAGKAWRVEMPPLGQREKPDYDATLDMAIVNVSGAHAFWDHWAMSVIHLWPIDGVKSATITTPGATHEFMILSLNPEEPLPGLVCDANWRLRWLTPIDVVQQFTAKDDAVAQQIFELAVNSIVDGIASPDQDWRPWWKRAIATTAQHYADGTHRIRLS